jgi:hypothetical protein
MFKAPPMQRLFINNNSLSPSKMNFYDVTGTRTHLNVSNNIKNNQSTVISEKEYERIKT